MNTHNIYKNCIYIRVNMPQFTATITPMTTTTTMTTTIIIIMMIVLPGSPATSCESD